MDMLKLKSKFMIGIVENILGRELSKALGEDVDINIKDIEAIVNEGGRLVVNISSMTLETNPKIVKKLMGL